MKKYHCEIPAIKYNNRIKENTHIYLQKKYSQILQSFSILFSTLQEELTTLRFVLYIYNIMSSYPKLKVLDFL